MTIAIPTQSAAPAQSPARPWRAGLPQAIRAEWTKLLSLRSTKWMLALTLLGSLAITALTSAHARNRPQFGPKGSSYQGFDPTNHALSGLFLASLVIGVLGALAVTGEYGTGTIRSSLAAVPRRPVFLGAKVVVVGALTLIVGEIVSFACFFLGQATLSGAAPTADLGQPGVFRAVALSGAFLALLALLGLGLGTAIRHTAGAIVAYAGVTLLVTIIVQQFAQSWSQYCPIYIFENSVAAVVPQPNALSATIGFVLMAVYAAAALCLGAVVLLRRDA
jgi:ABC-2 type transport system permease protein